MNRYSISNLGINLSRREKERRETSSLGIMHFTKRRLKSRR